MSDTTNIYSETPDLDTMGGRLSRARDAASLTVAQLARRLGVKSSTIQAWESDRSQPRANRLAMLAGVLNVSPSWILYGVGTSPSEDVHADLARSVHLNFERLRRLQEESNQLIGQIEEDLKRYSARM
ncbi:transcriptional regulator with XRE-family HTH domain [Mesorhizobium sp. J18]|uniref:helix-turn-helix domain-containing protein n=1 Tax=Mesorhizobium sp. J18 TaxID=935263 RepID=UPI00119A1042|nr:helix-turn-helix domain-containing protein [Mesorhizobium sp. J18]TWG99040.1 transcriptional regulator with XRE-family HTH domain [Mesorhizobium sp. J18]